MGVHSREGFVTIGKIRVSDYVELGLRLGRDFLSPVLTAGTARVLSSSRALETLEEVCAWMDYCGLTDRVLDIWHKWAQLGCIQTLMVLIGWLGGLSRSFLVG